MSQAPQPTDEMISEAAIWLTLLNDERVSAEDRAGCEAWCAADPLHRMAFERMKSLFDSFDEFPAAPARLALDQAFKPDKRRPGSRSMLALALAGMLACGWMASREAPVWFADQRTDVGERREVQLTDGSQLQLNTHSAVDIHFDGKQRVIELLRGEVWVIVAKDAQRPFVVRTDQGTVTALGTRFLVRRDPDQTTVVSVIESAIAARAEGDADVKVAAGQQAQFKNGRVQPPQPIGNADPSAWTRGVLTVNDQPLAQVLQTLARYRHGLISFDSAELDGLRVSGIFQLDDTDAALATLADNLPIKVQYFTDLLVRIRPTR